MASDEVAKPSLIPSYPEMILGAIEALDDKDGSNKSAISNYIEGKYGEMLSESHVSLLAAHLQRMKDGGEIMMVEKYYIKQDPNATPKRGRGRPPKPKSVVGPSSPRPRGRPPKDPLAVAVAEAASGFPRPRGRPPKKARPAGGAGEPAAASLASEIAMIQKYYMKQVSGPPPKRGRWRPPTPFRRKPLKPKSEADSSTPRRRGRPPKPKDPLVVAKAASVLPRPRGRPPKKARPTGDAGESAAVESSAAADSPAAPPGVKRGRGRPPKVKP